MYHASSSSPPRLRFLRLPRGPPRVDLPIPDSSRINRVEQITLLAGGGPFMTLTRALIVASARTRRRLSATTRRTVHHPAVR